ncbi:hypothetical protein PVAND_008126 [Polypedilum vanderplanki]|uniref:Ubiquitin-like-conjugating enzyme ATG10 n=1 Tax=Polypedilum vanderplanki TaxID=319348 RepID=A0A9J6CA09_POLVA|nr:hypothetical protein PVAND_008126 [Polypedilum vanderplanki]
MSVTFTQEQFNVKALEFLEMSEKVHDTWQKEEKENTLFLVKNYKFTFKKEPLNDADDICAIQMLSEVFLIEYHVLLHPSYKVPTIYFNAYKNDKLIDLNDIKLLFCDDYDKEKYEIYNLLSQSEHPILFRPFFMIHPCKIGEVLGKFTETRNFIITFLTLYGPSLVGLKLNNEYEKFFIKD